MGKINIKCNLGYTNLSISCKISLFLLLIP